MSGKIWWYAKNSDRFGPYDAAEFQTLGASGVITANDLVWKDGTANWLPATSIKGLLPQKPASTPPALPPSIPPNITPEIRTEPIHQHTTADDTGSTFDLAAVKKFNKVLMGIFITSAVLFFVLPQVARINPPLIVSLMLLASLVFTLFKLAKALGKPKQETILFGIAGGIPLVGFIAAVVLNVQANKALKTNNQNTNKNGAV